MSYGKRLRMKTSDLERKFYNTFKIPINYPLQLTNLKYLQLGALVFNCKSVKEFRQEILHRCINDKYGIDEQIRQIFGY